MKLSFIIPYKHNPERLRLLEATIDNLPRLEDITKMNIKKLKNRLHSNKIKGSGDTR